MSGLAVIHNRKKEAFISKLAFPFRFHLCYQLDESPGLRIELAKVLDLQAVHCMLMKWSLVPKRFLETI